MEDGWEDVLITQDGVEKDEVGFTFVYHVSLSWRRLDPSEDGWAVVRIKQDGVEKDEVGCISVYLVTSIYRFW